MTALIVILSLVGYMAIATGLSVYGARTAELHEIARAKKRQAEYPHTKGVPDPIDVFLVSFPAMFWPVTAAPLLASGIHERRKRAGTVRAAAEDLRAKEREQMEKDNARLEHELGIGGGS